MSVVLVDVRSRAAYDAGHLRGAVHLETEADLSHIGPDPAIGGRHPLPSDDQLELVFARAGINDNSFVLAVDDNSGWAARCWWLLRHIGHDEAGTLAIDDYVGPLTGDVPAPLSGNIVARPRTDDTIEAEEILARLDDRDLLLFDARSAARWRGDEEPLDPVAGRIPGARNLHFIDPLPADATAATEIATYCGSGVTACVVAQKLILAGRDDVRVYPGSFSEWCRRDGYPIEKGSP